VPYIQSYDEKVYNSDIQHSLEQKILAQEVVENIQVIGPVLGDDGTYSDMHPGALQDHAGGGSAMMRPMGFFANKKIKGTIGHLQQTGISFTNYSNNTSLMEHGNDLMMLPGNRNLMMRLSKIGAKQPSFPQAGTPEGFRSGQGLLNRNDMQAASPLNMERISKYGEDETVKESPIEIGRRDSTLTPLYRESDRRRKDAKSNTNKTPRDTDHGTVDVECVVDNDSTPNDSVPMQAAASDHS
jgi:hypothetical protein